MYAETSQTNQNTTSTQAVNPTPLNGLVPNLGTVRTRSEAVRSCRNMHAQGFKPETMALALQRAGYVSSVTKSPVKPLTAYFYAIQANERVHRKTRKPTTKVTSDTKTVTVQDSVKTNPVKTFLENILQDTTMDVFERLKLASKFITHVSNT